jgi:acetolactate synthase-1/2/3 large subunit
VKKFAQEGTARREQVAKAAANRGKPGEISPHYLCSVLAKALRPDDIVLNEAIRNGPVVMQQMPRTKAGTLVGLSGGGLGFSGGMALGLKLAQPDRTIVQIVGDGTFYFSNPQSTLAVGRQYKLPVLTVVLDNTGWAAVKEATLRVYPEGEAKAQQDYGSVLAPDMDFSKVAEAAGGHGELVSDPDAVEGAVARCVAAVKNGQSAILHARVTKL